MSQLSKRWPKVTKRWLFLDKFLTNLYFEWITQQMSQLPKKWKKVTKSDQKVTFLDKFLTNFCQIYVKFIVWVDSTANVPIIQKLTKRWLFFLDKFLTKIYFEWVIQQMFGLSKKITKVTKRWLFFLTNFCQIFVKNMFWVNYSANVRIIQKNEKKMTFFLTNFCQNYILSGSSTSFLQDKIICFERNIQQMTELSKHVKSNQNEKVTFSWQISYFVEYLANKQIIIKVIWILKLIYKN